MSLHSAKGKITLLRVSPNYGYNLPQEHLAAHVVITIDTAPGRAFGFNLTAGSPDLPTQLAMLAIVRDAYIHDLPIGLVVEMEPGKKMGLIFGIDLLQSPKPVKKQVASLKLPKEKNGGTRAKLIEGLDLADLVGP